MLFYSVMTIAAALPPARRFAALPVLASPNAAHTASVTMDFAYRLERSLDPEKRGPATGDSEDGGMSALDMMCDPRPLNEATASAAPVDATPPAALGTAAAAAASTAAPEPASSSEIFFSLAELSEEYLRKNAVLPPVFIDAEPISAAVATSETMETLGSGIKPELADAPAVAACLGLCLLLVLAATSEDTPPALRELLQPVLVVVQWSSALVTLIVGGAGAVVLGIAALTLISLVFAVVLIPLGLIPLA